MPQAQFSHDDEAPTVSEDLGRLPLAVTILADRPHLRAEIREDALAAGLRVGPCGELAVLLENEAIPLGDVVLIDCPQADGQRLAALARLDIRVAQAGAQMVVSTDLDSLDQIFGCVDQSGPQILVNPNRAERVIALGRVMSKRLGMRFRELSEEDRIKLLRISEQVEAIALKLDRLGSGLGPLILAPVPEGGTLLGASPASPLAPQHQGENGDGAERIKRALRPALPDPRLVRRIIRQRQSRARFFDGDLFADPAWDILLDLAAARAEHSRVSVTSLCIASCVPPTTALRWIGQMTEAGLLERVEDEIDRRRAFITLTDKAADAMARYFAELGPGAAQLV